MQFALIPGIFCPPSAWNSMVIPAKVGIQKIRKPSSFVPLGRGQGEDGKRGYRRQKTGGRRQFHAAASNVQNIHPRPAEAGYPRRPFDRLRVNGGGVSGMRFASLSFILCPLSLTLSPVFSPVFSPVPGYLPRWHLPVRL